MPGKFDSYWYTMDVGPMHVVLINTEAYYYLNTSMIPLMLQREWLEKELQKANLPDNRAKHPWLMVIGHHPMYCNNADGDDCSHPYTNLRIAFPFLRYLGVENLLYDYGVDLAIWGHEHCYERLWPLYKGKVYNGSYEAPYTNPKAPVHVTSGSAGMWDNINPFVENPADWSAVRIPHYGYARIKVYNSTHLYMEQKSVENGKVVDSFWIIKDKHGSYKSNE